MSVTRTSEHSAHWTPRPEFAHIHAHNTHAYYTSRIRIGIRMHIHTHTYTHTYTWTCTRRTDETTYNFVTVTNLALHKPTWQHSTWFGGVASRAVDGNANPKFGAGSCTHTNRHSYPTWGVDLQIMSIVYYVEIMRRDAYNRGKCLGKFANWPIDAVVWAQHWFQLHVMSYVIAWGVMPLYMNKWFSGVCNVIEYKMITQVCACVFCLICATKKPNF